MSDNFCSCDYCEIQRLKATIESQERDIAELVMFVEMVDRLDLNSALISRNAKTFLAKHSKESK